MRRTAAMVMVLALGLSASCGGGSEIRAAAKAPRPVKGGVPWPAPSDPLKRARDAGLEPERKETLRYHVHAHLDVFVNGRPVVVPAGVGINIHDPEVKVDPGPNYGGIKLCGKPCISPLHTHDTTGTIHTESKTARPNRLGQFFTEWDVRLDRSCVGGYCRPNAVIQILVNGKRYSGDPARISLADRTEIAIVIGSPPETVPSTFPA